MNYWLSWYSTTGMGSWELHSPWWISGQRASDDAVTVCAAVVANSEHLAKAKVVLSYDKPPSQIEWRFCHKRPDDWEPFSDRFPRAEWMKWNTFPSPSPE